MTAQPRDDSAEPSDAASPRKLTERLALPLGNAACVTQTTPASPRICATDCATALASPLLDHQDLHNHRRYQRNGRGLFHLFDFFGRRRLDDQIGIAANEPGGKRLGEQLVHPLHALSHHPRQVVAVPGDQFEASEDLAVRPEAADELRLGRTAGIKPVELGPLRPGCWRRRKGRARCATSRGPAAASARR